MKNEPNDGLTSATTVALACLVVLGSTGARADGYRTTVGEGADAIPLVVLSGTPHEMGLAMGNLMRADIQKFVPGLLRFAQASGDATYSNEALDAAWTATSKHMSPRYVEELRGVAEGSGVEFDTVRRSHMIPVVGNYSCSFVAAWGSATKNGDLYQIRNLDYNTKAHLQDFPMVAIYLPREGIAHMNVSFAGAIGVNTGMNAEGITLSEAGDSPEADRPYNLDGHHFLSMFRDILYDAHNLDEAVRIVRDAKRIKKYHYLIGDGRNKKAAKMKAHAPNLEIWSDNDVKDEVAPNVLKDIVYNAEGRDPIAYAHLKRNSGRYDADAMIQLSKAIGTLGGNLMDSVYDATTLEVWVAYANGADECAYRRPYVHISMKDYMPFGAKPEPAKIVAVYPEKK